MKARFLPQRIVVAASCSLAAAFLLPLDGAPQEPPVKLELEPTPPLREGALGGYADIVEKVSPSVVSVFSSRKPRVQSGPQYYFYDPYTGRLHPRTSPQRPQPEAQGLGSGVIISDDGYIVTNRHVIQGADEVKVAFGKRSEIFDAEIVGMDEATDVAVLKIDATGLPAIRLGDSSKLKVGDFVLAIGSPFGLRQTVTSGIVSALERSSLGLIGDAGYENFIQTDASINPGNSGGALVDNRGRMIGINTAIYSRSGGNVGIGFAIPTELAAGVIEQLIEFGEVQRGFLGIMLGDVTPELASALSVGRDGSIVHEVVGGSPAESAGFKPGDVVVSVAGTPVTNAAKLRLLVGGIRPGTEVDFEVIREGEKMTLKGVIGSQRGAELSSAVPARRGLPQPGTRAEADDMFLEGVELTSLDRSLRARLGDRVAGIEGGVVVRSVAPGSAAEEAGLSAGDVITEVARKPVASVDEAVAAAEEARAEGHGALLLRVVTDGGSRFVAVEMTSGA